MASDAPQVSAAYGRFYLDNRPILLREAELPGATDAAALISPSLLSEWGFHGARTTTVGRPDNPAGPFTIARQTVWATDAATDDTPSTLLGLAPSAGAIASAVARGVRRYSVHLESPELVEGPAPELIAFQRWLADVEDELTSSVEVRDPLAFLEYPPYGGADADGGFGVLATAGYNPAPVDLSRATDADLAEFPAAVFPSRGVLDLDAYGKLVVLTLRGATLVTYPQPVRHLPDGTPFRTTFLWPEPRRAARGAQTGERQVGRRIQVRDGISIILSESLGEPYAGEAYYRLPRAQRRAHRRLVLSLLEEAAPRLIVPDDDLEVEVVARLSPDGGALLFVINRIGEQQGRIALASPDALALSPPVSSQTLFATPGSSAAADGSAIRVRIGPAGILVLRLG